MAKSVSMQNIADRLGVSKYTVSQALSGKPGVGETTRSEVLAMARALGYRVRSANGRVGGDLATTAPTGEAVAPGACVHVAATEIHLQDRSYWLPVMAGIQSGCEERSWICRIATGPLPHDADRAIGYLVLGNRPSEQLAALSNRGKPLVLIDHEDPLIEADCVMNDNDAAAKLACRHLLGLGCQSIAFVGRDSFSVSFRERWWGVRAAVEEWGGKPTSGRRLYKWTVPYGGFGVPERMRQKIGIAKADKLPDGFVCANDEIALMLIEALAAEELRTAFAGRIVGIDNIPRSAASTPPLTTVEMSKEWLGYRAVEMLARRMRQPGLPGEKVILPARLIVRG